jgi:hypothetical protein
MSREQLRRVARLVEIRGYTLKAAQVEAARAATAAEQAARALVEAEARYDEVAAQAVVEGEFSIHDLEDARLEVSLLRRAAELAERRRDASVREQAERKVEVERAHVAVKQMETLLDNVRTELASEDRRLDRIDTDELASRTRRTNR